MNFLRALEHPQGKAQACCVPGRAEAPGTFRERVTGSPNGTIKSACTRATVGCSAVRSVQGAIWVGFFTALLAYHFHVMIRPFQLPTGLTIVSL